MMNSLELDLTARNGLALIHFVICQEDQKGAGAQDHKRHGNMETFTTPKTKGCACVVKVSFHGHIRDSL